MAENNKTFVDLPLSEGDKKAGLQDNATGQLIEIDAKRERALVRKMDYHIVPFVVLLYLVSFLDRVNIGNARLYGMENDLGLKPGQYQVAVSVLFATYCLFEVPSNLVIKKLTPRYFIAAITFSWGILATLTGITQNYGGLLACRLLLGAVEAGLFPGMLTYLMLFYNKHEIALRTGYLLGSAALSGACGGLLAYAIGFMDGTAGLRGWRWIMIIEGLPSVILSVLVWFFLANDLDSAYYFTEEERAIMVARRSRELGQTASAQQLHRSDVIDGATDWKTYAFAFAQFGVDTMLYGFSTFLPTIIKGLGDWSATEVQALTVPCYTVGAISYLVVAYISDKTQQRALFACLFCAISILGYGVLISNSSSGVHYFGCFLIATGLYVVVGIPLAWLPTNLPRYGKRSFSSGLQLTLGNMSGIMAPFLYSSGDAPRYIKGHAVTLCMVGFSGLVYAFMWVWYTKRNRERAAGMFDWKVAGKTEREIEEMGDHNPRYRYSK